MSREKLRLILGLILIIVFGIDGLIVGDAVSYNRQEKLNEVMRNTSGIVFAVLGIWLAVVCPNIVGKILRGQSSGLTAEEVSSLKVILIPFLVSSAILIFLICQTYFATAYTAFDRQTQLSVLLRRLSFGMLSSAFIAQVWSIVQMLVPYGLIEQELLSFEEKSGSVSALAKQNQVREKDDLRESGGL